MCVLAMLQSCGSGAVSDPASIPVAPVLSVSPPSATGYSGLLTSFTITGGSGTYTVISDNQGVIANTTVVGNTFAVVPSAVTSETKLNLTVKDSTSSVVVPLTVEPIVTAALGAQPKTIAFQGTAPGTCASNLEADVIVFGGHPPYVVSQPATFGITPSVVSSNPGKFTVAATGQCAAATPIGIVDAVGDSTSITASNTLSTATPPVQPAFTATPNAVTLTGCSDVATVLLLGGSGRYLAVSGNNSVYARINSTSPDRGFIGRQGGSPAAPNSVQVIFSDGVTAQPVTVTVNATGPC
jgi:hypothetical protein